MSRGGNYRRPVKQLGPPTTQEAERRVCLGVIKMFDRGDGEAADWPYLAQVLFRAALALAAKAPHSGGTRVVLRAAAAEIYDLLADNEAAGLPAPLASQAGDAPNPAPAGRPPRPRSPR